VRSCLEELELDDHMSSGPLFTWTNNQQPSFLARKLDRVLVNSTCLVTHLLSLFDSSTFGKHPDFLSIGDPTVSLFLELKRLKKELRKFNLKCYGDITGKDQKKRKELKEIQLATLSGSVNDKLLEMDKCLFKEYKSLLDAEESFYWKKSRIRWIQEGDQNTGFFHSMVVVRHSRHTIKLYIDDNGNRLDTFEQISKEAVDFYKKLIGSPDKNVFDCSLDLLKELLPKTFSTDAQIDLAKPIPIEEIKVAIFEQNGDKAPGPDGCTAHFFKVAWHIVGAGLLPAFNTTTIVLLPKVKNPGHMREFRPLSCCSAFF
ncbi:hypothetical protein V6Z12_D07G246000, partial [Gossypium hirsutum]